jgi:hypothetical protein
MLMLLFATHQLSSIIGDTGFIVSSVLLSAVTLLSSHMSTGNMGTRPLHEGPDHLSFLAPLQRLQVVVYLGSKFLQASQDQVELPLQRFCLDQLLALALKMSHALPESRDPRFEFLLVD